MISPSGPSWHSRSTCARSPWPAAGPPHPAPAGIEGRIAPRRGRLTPPGGAREASSLVQVAQCQSTRFPIVAAAPRTMGPTKASAASQLPHQGLDEGRREEGIVFVPPRVAFLIFCLRSGQLRPCQGNKHTSTRVGYVRRHDPAPLGRVSFGLRKSRDDDSVGREVSELLWPAKDLDAIGSEEGRSRRSPSGW